MLKPPKLNITDMSENKKSFPWSALAGIGGSLISGLFGSADSDDQNAQNWEIAKLNYKSQQETNQWNKLIADKANETNIQLQSMMNGFNRDMWNLNNEYNSPVQQLQRAAAAGINPNIVFGQPVASSPVQQTSIPNQVVPHMEAPLMNYNPISKGKYKFLQELGNMFSKLPFNKASLDIMKEEARGKAITNDLKAEELDDKRNEKDIYQSNGFVSNPNDSYDMIPISQYDELSDSDKKKYQVNGTPNLVKYSIRSRAGFEALKDIMNLPNFLSNISADYSQNALRKAVNEGKLKRNDVVNALIDTDKKNYDMVVETLKRIKHENNWSSETHDLRKHILELQDKQLQNAVDNDLKTWIDKIQKGDMSWSDWLKAALVVAATFR